MCAVGNAYEIEECEKFLKVIFRYARGYSYDTSIKNNNDDANFGQFYNSFLFQFILKTFDLENQNIAGSANQYFWK